jgi:uroporphyrinogen-III synthase
MEKTSHPISLLSTRLLRPDTLEAIARLNWAVQEHAFIATHGLLDSRGVEKILSLLGKGSHFNWPLFTSANAVKWLKTAFDEAGYIFPPATSVLCVGSITAQQVCQQLKAIPLVVAPHAMALVKKLPLYLGDAAAICYLCGTDRLDVLPLGLQSAGYKLTEIHVYTTQYTPQKFNTLFDFVLFFSPSAVESYFQLNAMPAHAVAVCIGHTTEATLRMYGVNEIIVSPKPDEASMLEAIVLWCNNHR